MQLSSTEFELLAYLLRHRGRVLTREADPQRGMGLRARPGTNVVDVYIGYLRRKMGLPGPPAPISTIRSVGYRLDDDVERFSRLLPVGIRWRLTAWVAAVLLLCFAVIFFAVYRGTGISCASRSIADRWASDGELLPRTCPACGRSPRQVARAAPPTCAPSRSAQARRCSSRSSQALRRPRTSPSFSVPSDPDNGESIAEQEHENRSRGAAA